MESHHLELSFRDSPEIDSKKGKELAYKYVCALLNSNGGVLSLKTTAKRDAIIRPIEQNIKEIIGSKITKHFHCMPTAEGFILKVKGHEQLCTMNYNAYLPSITQKIVVEPNEIEQMKKLLRKRENRAVHHTDSNVSFSLVYNKHIDTQESKTVQLKQIQSKKNLAASLLSNDLINYISAFANGCGGTLYCGVKDDGIVEGQILKDETEKEKFRTSVDKYINQMIWPEYIGKPKLGPDGQLEISFEPVIDHDGTPMPSRFVVVINVPACPGGVFVAEPESYHIVNGEVKKMEFTEWKRRLLFSNRSIRLIYKQHIGIQESETVKFEQIQFGEDFAASLFNSEWNRYVSEFANYSGGTLYCGVKDDGIVEGQTFKDEAEKEKFRTSVGEYIENMFWPEYIGKPKLGSDGQLEISFEPVIDRDGTPMPSRFVVVINVPACPGGVFCAKQHLESTDYVPQKRVDMRQENKINLALQKLGCSLTGDVVKEKVSKEDIEEAIKCLQCANDLELDFGLAMTGLRYVHYHLAKVFTYYRRAQLETSKEMRVILLEDAIRLVTDFKELSAYARKSTELFEELINKLE